MTLEIRRRQRGAAHGALVAICTRLGLLGARQVHSFPAACEPREISPRGGQRLEADPAYICFVRGVRGHPYWIFQQVVLVRVPPRPLSGFRGFGPRPLVLSDE